MNPETEPVRFAEDTIAAIEVAVKNYHDQGIVETKENLASIYYDVLNTEIEKLKRKIYNEFQGHSNSTIYDVISAVCDYYQIDPKQLENKTRRREVVEPKQLFHWLLQKKVVRHSLTLAQIGRFTGGQDHATVIHGSKVVTDRIELEREFREDVMKLCNNLGCYTSFEDGKLILARQ